ncbi:MAG TPA: glycosyltransferase family 2 protein, partial [Aliiroseovarius sp.]|nr:glycosyltransferase family 2 protein [Aliiroseovarius sp.]
SVVVPSDGNPGPLEETLKALSEQHLPAIETLVVADDAARHGAGPGALADVLARYPRVSLLRAGALGDAVADPDGVAGARNRGLACARGEAVVFLDAGDTLPPGALAAWHDRLMRAGAAFGFARMRMGERGGLHEGVHERFAGMEAQEGFVPDAQVAIRLHAHPSAKIFARAFLERTGITFAPGPLSSWGVTIAAATHARRAIRLAAPDVRIATGSETRQTWRAPLGPRALEEAVMQAARAARAPLGPEAIGRLFLRAVWEKLNHADFSADPDGPARLEAAAPEILDRLAQGHRITPDPYMGARLRQIFGLAD